MGCCKQLCRQQEPPCETHKHNIDSNSVPASSNALHIAPHSGCWCKPTGIAHHIPCTHHAFNHVHDVGNTLAPALHFSTRQRQWPINDVAVRTAARSMPHEVIRSPSRTKTTRRKPTHTHIAHIEWVSQAMPVVSIRVLSSVS
jgi:hypothetical protein